MVCGRVNMLLLLALTCAIVAEASILKENRRIVPALNPVSSAKFNQDYPGDKRPAVDVLHFGHPYPVVQDNDEFDKDFVKDENTDNGEWKAQSEYDRLRHKLAVLKKQAAEALEEKNSEKKQLDKAMVKYQEDMAKDKAEIAKRSNQVLEPVKPVKPTKPVKPEKPKKQVTLAKPAKVEKPKQAAPELPTMQKKEGSGWSWPFPWSWPKLPENDAPVKRKLQKPAATKAPPTPKPTPVPLDTFGAAREVEAATKNLEKCRDELAAAKAELKKLMDELEKAKVSQVEAREKLNQAKIKQTEAEKHSDKSRKQYTKESSEYVAAKAAYSRQMAVYEKLHAELTVAAAKVRAMRGSEDKDGGVYPTPARSTASSTATAQLLILIFAAVTAQCMA